MAEKVGQKCPAFLACQYSKRKQNSMVTTADKFDKVIFVNGRWLAKFTSEYPILGPSLYCQDDLQAQGRIVFAEHGPNWISIGKEIVKALMQIDRASQQTAQNFIVMTTPTYKFDQIRFFSPQGWLALFIQNKAPSWSRKIWFREREIEKEIQRLFDVKPEDYGRCVAEMMKGLTAIRASQNFAGE